MSDFVQQINQMAQLLQADGRDLDCVNVLDKAGKHVDKISLEDDGSQQDNLDVVLS